MIVFRHADPRLPFLHEAADQPPGRWHGPGGGPVHYLADTPDGAWAEFVRHEEIRDPADLAGVRRALWAVEIDDPPEATPNLDEDTLLGDRETYAGCQAEAARLRAAGQRGLVAPSAALEPGEARGWTVSAGLGPERDGGVIVLFGRRPDLVGWPAVLDGRPDPGILGKVRHFERKDGPASQ